MKRNFKSNSRKRENASSKDKNLRDSKTRRNREWSNTKKRKGQVRSSMLQPKRTKRTNKDKNKMKPDDILLSISLTQLIILLSL